MPRLGPAWLRGSNQGGRGFQPPPAATSGERRGRSGSTGSGGEPTTPSRPSNKFSVLDEDDDDVVAPGSSQPQQQQTTQQQQLPNSRSEGLRSASAGHHRPKPTGRSLADLAARAPPAGSGGGVGGRRASAEGSSSGGGAVDGGGRFAHLKEAIESDKKIIRFTRERLLSMRPQPSSSLPAALQHLEGTSILSKEPQDPVCWDTFDADEIWAAAVRERRSLKGTVGGGPPAIGGSVGGLGGDVVRRTSGPAIGGGGGRWQRGVALPPPDERRGGHRAPDADNPEELWDDPLDAPATDFSAFGTIPDDPKQDMGTPRVASGGAFDFSAMAEATALFDSDRLKGTATTTTDSDVDSAGAEDDTAHNVKVDPRRPLAAAGTTIRSGSGDDVNVFEDFDEDDVDGENAPTSEISSGGVTKAGEDSNASSRLMKMIGVESKGAGGEAAAAVAAAASTTAPTDAWGTSGATATAGTGAIDTGAIPSNPWGAPIIGGAPSAETAPQQDGMDLAARLEAAVKEQAAREAQAAEEQRRQMEQAELMRRRQEEEEAQRRAQQEAQARQQQQANIQQQSSGPSQVEIILMERISTILEASWGRSDLVSILTTLHNEDSRVIPLLGNIDALRSLIARHPRRVSIKMDPNGFGTELAVLLLTNQQWQQQQQQIAQQEEMQRQQQQLLMQQQQQQAAAARAQAEAQQQAAAATPTIIPDAPWFYADPQNNIQGPFKGEEMRQWLEAGYFKGDLPISQDPNGRFRPLSQIFTDLSMAFQAPSSSVGEDEARAAAIAAAEEEKQRAAAKEAEEAARAAAEQARIEAEAAAAKAEAERQQKEREAAAAEAQAAAAAAAAQEQNQSSAQLKMLLGLSGETGVVEADRSMPLVEEEQKEPVQQQQSEPKQIEKRPTKSKKSKQKAAPAPAPDTVPPAPASPKSSPISAPAWGGASSSTRPAMKKSMSEIQQEEARNAAILAMKKETMPRSSTGGWANVAAKGGGSTGWQGGALKSTPTAIVTNPARMQKQQTSQHNQQISAATPAGARQQAAVAAATARQQSQSKAAPTDEFGAEGRMSPALESWCKEQMRRLNGTDDLTLVSFCMTLNDSEEIKQYLTAYLGSTPQVNNFASEFVNRKLGKSQQDEWESANPKKARKKKAGAK